MFSIKDTDGKILTDSDGVEVFYDTQEEAEAILRTLDSEVYHVAGADDTDGGV